MGRPIRDLSGETFGSWYVLGLAFLREGGRQREPVWRCRCVCGLEKDVLGRSLTNGVSKSCQTGKCSHSFKHGLEGAAIYDVWSSMKARCQNPDHRAYKNYGGRGISVCDEWQDFNVFLADMGIPPEGYELDRIDNEGGYSKENCHWVTRTENLRNRRNTVRVTWYGKTQTIPEWSAELGISKSALHRFHKRGDTDPINARVRYPKPTANVE